MEDSMRTLKFFKVFVSVLFLFQFLIFRNSQAQGVNDKFWIGAWCLTGSSDLYDIIEEPTPDHWVLKSKEKTFLEDLGLNYMIACTRGWPYCTTNGEVALNNYGIERNGAFKSTLEVSPPNASSSQAYQVWKAIDWPIGGPGNPTWEAYVNNGYASMDTLHSDKRGVHSFLAGAEHELEHATKYPWLNYMCNSIHVNAPGVLALVQDNYSALHYLGTLFQQVPNLDIFSYHYYVFVDGLPYSGTSFQNALQNYVTAASYAATELQTYLPNVPLHFMPEIHEDPGNYRLTTKEEILCQDNLALAYGAKGLVYYLYGSLNGGVNGLVDISRNPTAQYNVLKSIHDNYQNTGKTIYEIGTDFMSLNWQAGYSIHQHVDEPIDTNYDLYDVQSKILGGSFDPENETYVEVGILKDSNNISHFMIVNRRCVASREITITFESINSHGYLITDIFNTLETRYLPANNSTISYTFTLGPGEGKLLKLEDLGESNSITSNTIWVGTIFVNQNIALTSGVSLSIQPETLVKFASGTRLTINGTLYADGATFTSASSNPGSGDWYGIVFDNADNNSYIKNSTIEYATYGIECIDCSPMIGESGKPNTIQYNSSNGVRCHQASPAISYNTIWHNGIGIYCEYNSNPDIAQNYVIDNNSYGIFCTQTCNPYIRHNEVSNNGPGGIYCLNSSSPNLIGKSSSEPYGANKIISNGGNGVSAFSSSNPNLGFQLGFSAG
jgi:parallel beta-helix repeat protein